MNESASIEPEHQKSAEISSAIRADQKAQAKNKTPVGSGCRPRRRSNDDEKCLGIDEQVDAISAFVRSSSGEFCMAVFGPWGRGKTFLLQQVQKKLTRDNYHSRRRHVYGAIVFPLIQ